MKIYQAMIGVMADAEPIAKDRQNKGQGYAFRGIDDVYAALQAVMVKHKVFSVPTVLEQVREERTSKSGGLNIYSILKIKYTFYTDDGSSVEAVVIGEGMDSGDKASNKGMSVAHKYALLQAFSIPTKEPKDPEEEDHDLEPKQPGNYHKPASKPAAPQGAYSGDPGEYKLDFGKYIGKTFNQMGVAGVKGWKSSLEDRLAGKPAEGKLAVAFEVADKFLAIHEPKFSEDEIPF